MTDTAVMLYLPIDTLKPVHENFWIVDGPVIRMAALGTSLPFPTRMSVIRLRDGGLWCHSPTALTPQLKIALDALGPVRHLVSPNMLHYAHIAAWKKTYPQATAWASPGVRERAAKHAVAVDFDADLGDVPPPQWTDEIDQLIFLGSRVLREIVFFHRASRTLVLTDLIENFQAEKLPGPLMRWMVRLAGCSDPDGKAPVDMRMTFWGRKALARRCLERILAWQPETVILAHGRWYREHGTEELRRAFRWLQ